MLGESRDTLNARHPHWFLDALPPGRQTLEVAAEAFHFPVAVTAGIETASPADLLGHRRLTPQLLLATGRGLGERTFGRAGQRLVRAGPFAAHRVISFGFATRHRHQQIIET